MIDLKTLYEQITMSCILIKEYDTPKYHIEIYWQEDTPIYMRAIFLLHSDPQVTNSIKLHEISFSTDKGAYIR